MSAINEVGSTSEASARGKWRSPAIFGVRGLAAAALLTVHVAMFSGLLGTKALGTPRPPSNFLGAFFVSGLPSFIGVFFVLPAMFLYLPLAKAIISGTRRPLQGRSFLRRLLRLLPAYYLMCVVALLAFNRESIDGVWYVLRPLLLLQVYLPSPFEPKLMNGLEITWTVPTMVQWYAVLPLIAIAVHKFAARGATPVARARRLMLPVPVLIAVGFGWLFFVKANGWDNRIVFWWPQGFAPTIGVGMALAILLALAQVSPQDTPKLLLAAARRPNLFFLGAGVVFLVNCARPFSVIGMDAIYSVSGLLSTYLLIALFGLLVVVPLVAPGADSRLIRTTLANRPVVFLGRISFGVYLWHFAVMHLVLQPGGVLSGQVRPIRELYGTSGFWRLEIATLVGSVVIASISYFLVEQPLVAWGERRLRDRPPGRAHPAGHRPTPAIPVAPVAAMTLERAMVAVATAAADRDAIRSNLVDLESGFDRCRPVVANLIGQSRQRWDGASTDLATLWEMFGACSGVVDDAVQIMANSRRPADTELATLTHLLGGPSVELGFGPAPLAERHITDSGRDRLTLDTAIQRMNLLFTNAAALLATVEPLWNDVALELDRIGAELARARSGADDVADAALAALESELDQLRQMVNTDPLALIDEGGIATTGLDRLRRRIASATTGRGEPGSGGGAE